MLFLYKNSQTPTWKSDESDEILYLIFVERPYKRREKSV
jgi:hypothetical protein